MSALPVPEAIANPTNPILHETISAIVDPVAQDLIARGESVGLVVGVVAGEQSWSQGYGARSASDPTSPTAATLYEVASIGKMFTYTMVFDAISRGEMALEDSLADYLPTGLILPKGGEQITIAHLVDHASGLPETPPSLPNVDPWDFAAWLAYDLAKLGADLPRTELLYAPGTDTSYSTYGAGLLGLALSMATGLDYDALLHSRITEPLRMDNTWQTIPDAARSRLVPGYHASGQENDPLQLDVLKGCGGMISCVQDMLVWLRSLIEVDPVVAAGMGCIWRGADLDPAQADGWNAPFYGPDTRIGAAGRSNGYKSCYLFFPKQRVGVVILANTQSFEIDSATEKLAVELRSQL